MKTKKLTTRNTPDRVYIGMQVAQSDKSRLDRAAANIGMFPGPLARRLVLEGLAVMERADGLTPAQVMQVAS
jgi:hypothetical protein